MRPSLKKEKKNRKRKNPHKIKRKQNNETAMILVVNIYVRYSTNSEKEQSSLLSLLMVILNLMVRPYCWKLLNRSSQTWRNKADNDLELLLYQDALHRKAGRGEKSSKVFSCESWQYGHDWLGNFGIFDVTGVIHGFLIGFRTLSMG